MHAAVLATILALFSAAAWADDPSASVGLQVEVDGEDGRAVAGDLTWFAGPATQVFASASFADTGNALAGLSTRGFSIGAGHDFGRIALDGWYEQWQDSDVVTARSFNAALHVEAGAVAVSLLGQLRDSEFEPFDASATVTLRTGQTVTVNAVADCTLDNSGLGLGFAWRGERLEAYARAMWFDYDDVGCSFDSPALELLRRNRPAIFAQFAPRVTAPLAVNATTRIGAENALLEYSAGAGVGWDTGARRYGLDYLHQRDYFTALEAGTLSASVAFRVDAGLELTVEGGATDGDALSSVWFAGLGLRKLF